MAAPNLRNPVTITGEATPYSCTGTLSSVLANAAASNKLLKVNTIRATNVTGSSATVDISFYRGSTHTYLAKSSSVPANSALVVNDKNEYIYLEEGDSIYAKASATSTIDLLIFYEEVS